MSSGDTRLKNRGSNASPVPLQTADSTVADELAEARARIQWVLTANLKNPEPFVPPPPA